MRVTYDDVCMTRGGHKSSCNFIRSEKWIVKSMSPRRTCVMFGPFSLPLYPLIMSHPFPLPPSPLVMPDSFHLSLSLYSSHLAPGVTLWNRGLCNLSLVSSGSTPIDRRQLATITSSIDVIAWGKHAPARRRLTNSRKADLTSQIVQRRKWWVHRVKWLITHAIKVFGDEFHIR